MLFSRKSSFYASTETLSSVTTTSSTSTLLKKPSAKAQEKDYFAALGALQSQYGFGGGAPTPVTLPKATKSMKTKSTKSEATPPAATTSKTTKDYEAAYGALSSSYGFGGAPVPSASWSGKK